MCDHIMIIAGGRLVANDSIVGLLDKYCTSVTLTLVVKATKKRAEEALSQLQGISEREYVQNADGTCSVRLVYHSAHDVREAVWTKLSQAGICVLEMTPHQLTLEDIFISLTNAPHTEEDEPEDKTTVPKEEKKSAPVAEADDNGDDDDDDNDDNDGKNADGSDYKPLFS